MEFIDYIYNLDNINKGYQVQFYPLRNEDYWSNEMDQPFSNKHKSCSYCYNEGHHRRTYSFYQQLFTHIYCSLFCIINLLFYLLFLIDYH